VRQQFLAFLLPAHRLLKSCFSITCAQAAEKITTTGSKTIRPIVKKNFYCIQKNTSLLFPLERTGLFRVLLEYASQADFFIGIEFFFINIYWNNLPNYTVKYIIY